MGEVAQKRQCLIFHHRRVALFGVQVPAISKHLKNIFEGGKLQENSVISILETTADDGKTYQVQYYNLDAIISVGYRVNSHEATQFSIGATNTLKEYMGQEGFPHHLGISIVRKPDEVLIEADLQNFLLIQYADYGQNQPD
jgi:hypothetical protein